MSPRPENVDRIALVLDVPVSFFALPPRPIDPDPTFYRSLSGATKADRLAASLRLAWIGDIVSFLESYVELPAMSFPTLVRRTGPLPDALVGDAANELRRQWSLGDAPIHNVVALIEAKGGVVSRAEAESPFIDAFSKYQGGRPCILLGNEKGIAPRSRFDAAHEVGHMVIHREVTKKQVATPFDLRQIENEANEFASAFLLPATRFADDLYVPTLDRMRSLKPKWKVSIAAMLTRASHLGLVSEKNSERLWISLARRGWRRSEPGDEAVPLEQPRLLARAFELVVEGGYALPLAMLEGTNHSLNDVRRYAMLNADFFGSEPPPVRLLDRVRPQASYAPTGTADVLPFRRRDD